MTTYLLINDQGRLVRFLIVGVGAAVLLFVLAYLFVNLGMAPFAGSTLAYAIAFVVAYTAQKSWTFKSRESHGTTLPRYFVLQAGCAIVSGVTAHTAVTHFGASPFMMSAVTTGGMLQASHVIHVVGPRYRADQDNARLLSDATTAALAATAHRLARVEVEAGLEVLLRGGTGGMAAVAALHEHGADLRLEEIETLAIGGGLRCVDG